MDFQRMRWNRLIPSIKPQACVAAVALVMSHLQLLFPVSNDYWMMKRKNRDVNPNAQAAV